MKKLVKIICVVAFCVVSIMGTSSVCNAEGAKYTDNVIPAMTNNTSPNGEASGSPYLSGVSSHQPWYAFNHTVNSSTDAWATKETTNGWLAYEFESKKCITKYTLSSRNPVAESIKEMPKNWTFEAWNEAASSWVILDKQTNITSWTAGVKKEFYVSNSDLYKKYRINISSNGGYSAYTAIGEMEMMEIDYTSNLKAEAGNKSVILKWDQVYGATEYIIKYGTDPTNLDKIKSVSVSENDNCLIDGLINGTKYYFTVSTIVNGGEKQSSVIVSATPKSGSDYEGNSAILEIIMTNGTIKEYSLTDDELESFLTWYDNRSDGVGKSYYRIPKKSNVRPFLSRKEYLSFDKIYSFEVKDYNE